MITDLVPGQSCSCVCLGSPMSTVVSVDKNGYDCACSCSVSEVTSGRQSFDLRRLLIV
jgi:hypothetical protein